jgi:hypothetical protein
LWVKGSKKSCKERLRLLHIAKVTKGGVSLCTTAAIAINLEERYEISGENADKATEVLLEISLGSK